MYKIAAIGDRDSILGFRALGISIFPTTSKEDAAERLGELRDDDYAIIFITEPLMAEIQSLVDDVNAAVLPAVIPIPNNRGTTGIAMERLRRTVEKAVGIDILFQKEGDK